MRLLSPRRRNRRTRAFRRLAVFLFAAFVFVLAGCIDGGRTDGVRGGRPSSDAAVPPDAASPPNAPAPSDASGRDDHSGIAQSEGTRSPMSELSWEDAFGLAFDTPVAIRHAGDGSGRLYVVEQPGRIQVVVPGEGRAEKRLFLDLTDRVYDRGWEQGLLGLAFHPDYAENGIFYVNYTTRRTTVIAEYRRSDDDPLRADPASGRILLEFSQPYQNHNGGELAFGPDGHLYIATGDGGSAGDPQGNAQNVRSWLGKILRIDVDGRADGKPYAVPLDNPFYGNAEGALEEIYAYGLRNPWRFSFDPATGMLWAADVGQDRREEINIIEKGGNYGWNVMEGTSCFRAASCEADRYIAPVFEYEPEDRASVTGGYVYRGRGIPGLVGHYVFADFMDGRVWTLDADGDLQAKEHENLRMPGITSFGTDEDGELYACLYDGRILRLVPKTG